MRPMLLVAALLVAGCADPSDDRVAEPAPSGMPRPDRPDRPDRRDRPDRPTSPQAPSSPPAPPRSTAPTGGASVVVASVTDGDTLRLRGGARVRLVQVDTPEVRGRAECGGRAASAALERQLPPGTRARLVSEPAGDRVDRYGRLLRYVYRGNRNLNVWLVRQGHAAPYFYDGVRGRFAVRLERAAAQARTERRGFWGRCPNAVLDAYRGVDTGQLAAAPGPGGAAQGAAALGTGEGLPIQPAGGPDVDCGQLPGPVRVTPGDPHRLDADGDGIGCD